jgi:TonB family protein
LPLLLLLAAVGTLSTSPLRAQDFYEIRLHAGEDNLRANRALAAAIQLRIAAFGLLDRPVLLSEALACLALAQERAGHAPEADAALIRFADVERRFAPYEKSALSPDLKAEFESLARRRLPASTLASLPAFSGGSPRREASAATPKPPRSIAPTPRARANTAAVPPTPAPERARPVQSADGGNFEPEDVDTPPRIKKSTRASYPSAALDAGVGGNVLLRVLVSENGVPLEVEVIRGIRPDLTQAAIEAVKDWMFEPARRGGRKVRSWTPVSIPFNP